MTLKEAERLKAGDVVWWDDPDTGTCSRLYKIKEVRIHSGMIAIVDITDDFLECLAKELSFTDKPRKFKVKICWNMEGEVEVEAFSKGHAIVEAMDAPLPPSDTWTYVPDSCCVVNQKLDVKEIQ